MRNSAILGSTKGSRFSLRRCFLGLHQLPWDGQRLLRLLELRSSTAAPRADLTSLAFDLRCLLRRRNPILCMLHVEAPTSTTERIVERGSASGCLQNFFQHHRCLGPKAKGKGKVPVPPPGPPCTEAKGATTKEGCPTSQYSTSSQAQGGDQSTGA